VARNHGSERGLIVFGGEPLQQLAVAGFRIRGHAPVRLLRDGEL
jgi:hypothetical protein